MVRIIRNISILLCLLSVMSCNNNSFFDESKKVNEEGWMKDSVVDFKFNITDTISEYQVIVNIRHSASFQTQNLWLFTSLGLDGGQLLKKDTIECYLANNAGEWLGSGFGSLYEMSILALPRVRFSTIGEYNYRIAHGMRNDPLFGISDVGVEIVKFSR